MRQHGCVACINGVDISDQTNVFETYGRELKAPNGYFGENWNAFNDCLLDLDWISEFDVYIVHFDLPRLERSEMVDYLEILEHAVKTWMDEKTKELCQLHSDFVPHRLVVFFPEEAEQEVLSYLSS
ncbi:barstar family protein [Halomonas sp. DP8Y7-3]|uniref:barstar family protein n=1 Tax=Halomonas sp. DP8Y7-3 TaxID=2859079 RepID=UPI001C9482D9|nr:barstar family protein [Halomonas sp. DP8Y7-3]MBY5927782.1 barstar family protein [Halomonas sp. DP8Y7-3]